MKALKLAVLYTCMLFRFSDAIKQWGVVSEEPMYGKERVVFQTSYGDIEFGFFPKVAPITVAHITKLARLGCYNTNHIFRVDRGFVAQVASVVGGREAPMNAEQQEEAEKSIVGEFSGVKHTRGILSMGRYEDPNTATSSFSMLLGDAPHLDRTYAVFGKVTHGDDVLRRLENLETKQEGMFVMPLERVTIFSTYVYEVMSKVPDEFCGNRMALMKRKVTALEAALQEARRKCLP